MTASMERGYPLTYSRAALLLTALCIGLTGCSEPAPTPPTPPAGTAVPAVPEELIGSWNMITERGNAFSYQINRDGKYVYVGIMIDGSLKYTIEEGGRAAFSGSQITFNPQIVTLTRTDPQDPGTPSTRSRPQRPPRAFTWRISGTTLTLVGAEGASTFVRD